MKTYLIGFDVLSDDADDLADGEFLRHQILELSDCRNFRAFRLLQNYRNFARVFGAEFLGIPAAIIYSINN